MGGNSFRAFGSFSHAIVHLMNQLIKTQIPQSRVLARSLKLTENRVKVNKILKVNVISLVDL